MRAITYNPGLAAAILGLSVTTFMGSMGGLLSGCAGQQLNHTSDKILENSYSEPSGSQRPDWVSHNRLPQENGRIFLVSSSFEGFSEDSGVRLAKAYALAQLSEQAAVAVNVNSKLKTEHGLQRLHDDISWSSAAMFRSMRQDKVYWEETHTEEGTRYHVWVLWSIPDRAFYEAQQEALDKTDKSNSSGKSGT